VLRERPSEGGRTSNGEQDSPGILLPPPPTYYKCADNGY
jgi:hypothetical protein